MFYCKKCSRLLEEDLKKCPYCGASEEQEDVTQVEQEEIKSELESKPESLLPTDTELSKLNDIINNNKQIEEQQKTSQQERIIIEPTNNSSSYTRPVDSEISGGMKALYILLSIFIAPAGIIVGAIYMSKDNIAYKSLGKTMLIISISAMVLSVICCCVFYFIAIAMAAGSSFGSF